MRAYQELTSFQKLERKIADFELVIIELENDYLSNKAMLALAKVTRLTHEIQQAYRDKYLTVEEKQELSKTIVNLGERVEKCVLSEGIERDVIQPAGDNADSSPMNEELPPRPEDRGVATSELTAAVLLAKIEITCGALTSDLRKSSIPRRSYEFFVLKIQEFENQLLSASSREWSEDEVSRVRAELSSLKSRFNEYRQR